MIAEVIVGQPDVGNVAWIGITAVIVVAAYAVAVAVPNIWPVMVRLTSSLQSRLTCWGIAGQLHALNTCCYMLRPWSKLRSKPSPSCADNHGSNSGCGDWVDLPCLHHTAHS